MKNLNRYLSLASIALWGFYSIIPTQITYAGNLTPAYLQSFLSTTDLSSCEQALLHIEDMKATHQIEVQKILNQIADLTLELPNDFSELQIQSEKNTQEKERIKTLQSYTQKLNQAVLLSFTPAIAFVLPMIYGSLTQNEQLASLSTFIATGSATLGALLSATTTGIYLNTLEKEKANSTDSKQLAAKKIKFVQRNNLKEELLSLQERQSLELKQAQEEFIKKVESIFICHSNVYREQKFFSEVLKSSHFSLKNGLKILSYKYEELLEYRNKITPHNRLFQIDEIQSELETSIRDQMYFLSLLQNRAEAFGPEIIHLETQILAEILGEIKRTTDPLREDEKARILKQLNLHSPEYAAIAEYGARVELAREQLLRAEHQLQQMLDSHVEWTELWLNLLYSHLEKSSQKSIDQP